MRFADMSDAAGAPSRAGSPGAADGLAAAAGSTAAGGSTAATVPNVAGVPYVALVPNVALASNAAGVHDGLVDADPGSLPGDGRRLPRWVLPLTGVAAVAVAATAFLIIRSATACTAAPQSPDDLSPGEAFAAGPVLAIAGAAFAAGPEAAANPVVAAAEVRSGKATFYGADGGGNCSFERPGAGMYVALGPSEYAGGSACGGYYDVTGPKGTVRVKVTDKCPECQPGHLDLSAEAFARIGSPGDGVVPVTYRQVVDPPLPGPLTVRVKEGASRYWFAVRIDNHGNPLTRVEVSGGAGWVALARTDYNYWIKADGAGPGPYSLRLTDVSGHQVTLGSVALAPETVQRTATWMYGASAAKPASPTPSPSPSTSPAPSPVSPSPSGGVGTAGANVSDRATPSVTSVGKTSSSGHGRCR